MAAVPLPWWTSRSTTSAVATAPRACSARIATATSWMAQKPSPWSGKAWWKPPPKLKAQPSASARSAPPPPPPRPPPRRQPHGAHELRRVGPLQPQDLRGRKLPGLELPHPLLAVDQQDVFVGRGARLEEVFRRGDLLGQALLPDELVLHRREDVRAQVQVVPVRVDELEGEHREILRRNSKSRKFGRKTKLAPVQPSGFRRWG